MYKNTILINEVLLIYFVQVFFNKDFTFKTFVRRLNTKILL